MVFVLAFFRLGAGCDSLLWHGRTGETILLEGGDLGIGIASDHQARPPVVNFSILQKTASSSLKTIGLLLFYLCTSDWVEYL